MVDDTPVIEIKNGNEAKDVLSSFIKTKDVRYFKAFDEFMKSKGNSYVFIDLEVDSISDLNINTGNGNLIDYIIDYYDKFGYSLKKLLVSDMSVISEMIKRNNPKLLDYIEEEFLYKEYESGKSLFDYLLDNNLLSEKLISKIYKVEYVDKLRQKDVKYLKFINPSMARKYMVGDVNALEYLFQSGLIDSKKIAEFYSGDDIYLLCEKYNRYDLLPYLQEGVLSCEIDNKTILEHLLEKNIDSKESYFTDEKLIKILLNHKKFQYFISSMESSLLKKVDGDKTVLEILLENGVVPTTSFLRNKESLNLFLKYKIYEKLSDYDLETLVSLKDLNNTYLDFVLDQMSQGLDFKLSKINKYSDDKAKVAKFYIIVARHGYINHIDRIDEKDLIKDNGKLLKELLSQDRDLTLNTILSPSIKENFDVAVLLRLNGIEQKDIKINLHSMNIVDEYFEKFNSQFREYELDEEGKALIDEFRTLMLSDDLSTPKMIDAMITSYTYLIATKNEYGIREIKKLIEIKKAKPEFCIRLNKDGSFYREIDNSINLENVGLNTLNHETGHALYHNLTDQDIPEDYERLLYEIRSNPETIIKIGNYSAKFQEIRNRVIKYVEEEYMKDYHLSDEELASLDEFLNTQKEETKKSYLEQGYDEETIDTILNGIYSKEEYIEQDKRIKREELVDAILRSEYGAFITIGDILDAIYIGRFKSNEVRNRDNIIIQGAYGHGIAYYDRGVKWSFDETMANYSAIMKSVDAQEIMNYLKEIVGEEYLNCISEYYTKRISLSTKDLNQKEEKAL